MYKRGEEAPFARIVGHALLLSFFFAQSVFAASPQVIANFPSILFPYGVATDGTQLYATGFENSSYRLYSVNKDGSNLQTVHTFSSSDPVLLPLSRLAISGNMIYGVGIGIPGHNFHNLFTMGTDGSGLHDIYDFINGTPNQVPYGDLTLAGNTLYGISHPANANNHLGQLYSLNTDGSSFQVLRDFGTDPNNLQSLLSDVVPSGGWLYGTTVSAGQHDEGTIYRMSPDGSNFQTLFSFPFGMAPVGQLTISGSTLYGLATATGNATNDKLFSIHLDGSGFQTVHDFARDAFSISTENAGNVVVVGNTIYGASLTDFYSVGTDGSNFQKSHLQGVRVGTNLLFTDSTIYGTTEGQSGGGHGTLYSLAVPEPSSILLGSFGLIALVAGAWRRGLGRNKTMVRLLP